MRKKRIELGRILVRSGALRFGDADFPPVGALAAQVPCGDWSVSATVLMLPDEKRIGSFEIVFSDKVDVEERQTFAIDGGVLGIADPDIENEVPRTFLAAENSGEPFISKSWAV